MLFSPVYTSEIFPSHYKAYRNDRGILGGGVFVLVHEDLIAEEKAELATDGEIEWVQVKLNGNKNLLESSFYMPHRNLYDINELRRSLELAMDGKEKHVVVAGDFNYLDILIGTTWQCGKKPKAGINWSGYWLQLDTSPWQAHQRKQPSWSGFYD